MSTSSTPTSEPSAASSTMPVGAKARSMSATNPRHSTVEEEEELGGIDKAESALGQQALANEHSGHHRRRKQRLFGLEHGQTSFRPKFADSNNLDYSQKYPEDEWGEEWGDNARVWKVYLDEAQTYDHETTEGWKDTLDVFLVFTGLFSAVEATFIAVSIQALRPDYAQATAFLLMEQIALQRALAAGLSLDKVPPSLANGLSPASPSTNNLWVNRLWVLSLALSLCAALGAVLFKQWIKEYTKSTSGSPQERARVRQFRFADLERWRVSLIISLIPLPLHIALFLFLIGLVIFILPLDDVVGKAILAGTVMTFACYGTSNLLPFVFPDCPYKTPGSVQIYDMFFGPTSWLASNIYTNVKRYTKHVSFSWSWPFLRLPAHHASIRYVFGHGLTLRGREAFNIERQSDTLSLSSVTWLYCHSPNPTAPGIALESHASLPITLSPPSFSGAVSGGLFQAATYRHFIDCIGKLASGAVFVKDDVSLSQLERSGRAAFRLAETSPEYSLLAANTPTAYLLKASPWHEEHLSIRLKHIGHWARLLAYNQNDHTPHGKDDISSMLLEIFRSSHPSIWAVSANSLFAADYQRLVPLLSNDGFALDVFRLIPPTFASDPWDFVKGVGLLQCTVRWALAQDESGELSHLVSTFQEAVTHNRMGHRSRSLAGLLFCQTLLHFMDAMTPQEILALFSPTGHLGLISTHILPTDQSQLNPLTPGELRDPQGLCSVLRQICLKISNRLPPDISGISSPDYLKAFLLCFHDREFTFRSEELRACSALVGSLSPPPGSPRRPLPTHINILLRCLSQYLELSTDPSALPLDPGPPSLLLRVYDDHRTMALFFHTLIYGVFWDMTELEDQALTRYARLLHLAARLNPGFLGACFKAICALVENMDVHYASSIGYQAHYHLNALLYKLKELDPSCGGFEHTNVDGISNMNIYARVDQYGSVPDRRLRAEEKVVAIEDKTWVVAPLPNTLAHIFDDPPTASPDPSPSRVRGWMNKILHELHKNSANDPVEV